MRVHHRISGTLHLPAHLPCMVRHDMVAHGTLDVYLSRRCRRYEMIHGLNKHAMLLIYAGRHLVDDEEGKHAHESGPRIMVEYGSRASSASR